jgi:hypothetical protein
MKKFLIPIAILLLMSGCSEKNRFTPKKVNSTLAYTTQMPAALNSVTREGATFDNGYVVTKDKGLLKISLPQGFKFINEADNSLIIADNQGEIKLLSQNGDEYFSKTFDTPIASASLRGDQLAIVFTNNHIMLYNIKQDKMIYKEELDSVTTYDARLANPLFLNDLIIFPTLDGRLLVMNSHKKVVIRDIAISDRDIFNNVLFLGVENDILIAATATKVVSINPDKINNLRVGVKDIIYKNSQVYIFTKAGQILLTDTNLKTIKKIKFPFAVFSSIFDGEKLFMVEKQGYLIEVEKDLSSYKVYKFPDEIESLIFSFQDRVFYGDKFLKMK